MNKMLTPHDVADELKISYDSALSFIKYSGIFYIRIGHQYRVSYENLQKFIAQSGQIHVDLTGLNQNVKTSSSNIYNKQKRR